jgi:hypothetical protein
MGVDPSVDELDAVRIINPPPSAQNCERSKRRAKKKLKN